MKRNNIGFEIRNLSNLFKRDFEKTTHDLGISSVKGVGGWAIKYLYENRGKDIFQKDFENEFSIRSSTATNILKALEQKGLIERVSVSNDARLKKIVLTDKAVEIHKQIKREIEEREQRIRKGISRDELDTFFAVLDKIARNLEVKND